MERFTKKVRDEIVRDLQHLVVFRSVVDRIAAIEPVEDEPVTYADANVSLAAAGWTLLCVAHQNDVIVNHYVRDSAHCMFAYPRAGDAILWTRYCPIDLLDGRLAALDKPEDPKT